MGTGLHQAEIDKALWEGGDHVAEYASRMLRPVDVVILGRYREALSGRVLEIGCGGGRVLGYLLTFGADVVGIDISQAMIDHCRRAYPDANVRVGDLRNLAASIEGPFDAVLATYNVLDVVDDAERRRVLLRIREDLSPDGLLIFSSHNLAHAEHRERDGDAAHRGTRQLLAKLDRPPHVFVNAARRLPLRVRNRRRLAPLERHEADHAILNDEALATRCCTTTSAAMTRSASSPTWASSCSSASTSRLARRGRADWARSGTSLRGPQTVRTAEKGGKDGNPSRNRSGRH